MSEIVIRIGRDPDVVATITPEGVSYHVEGEDGVRVKIQREDAIAVCSILTTRYVDDVESLTRKVIASLEDVEQAIGRIDR